MRININLQTTSKNFAIVSFVLWDWIKMHQKGAINYGARIRIHKCIQFIATATIEHKIIKLRFFSAYKVYALLLEFTSLWGFVWLFVADGNVRTWNEVIKSASATTQNKVSLQNFYLHKSFACGGERKQLRLKVCLIFHGETIVLLKLIIFEHKSYMVLLGFE